MMWMEGRLEMELFKSVHCFLQGGHKPEIQEYCGGCTSKNLTPFNF